jgi:hypothetical protein
MISRLNHVNVFVLDQDRAKAFYTETLGFELRNDAILDGFRWLTVVQRTRRRSARSSRRARSAAGSSRRPTARRRSRSCRRRASRSSRNQLIGHTGSKRSSGTTPGTGSASRSPSGSGSQPRPMFLSVTRSPDAADRSIASMTSWRPTASAKSGTVLLPFPMSSANAA